MKNLKSLLAGTVIGLSSLSAFSQAPTLPAASPAASVSQTFGITKVEINYSSPGVKGRQIWGSLVPYDSVWRTGANQATNISFSTDVMINGAVIKKGNYALFTIPGRNSWTFIINTDAEQFGAFNYKKSLDVTRFTVVPESTDVPAPAVDKKKKSKMDETLKAAEIKERLTFMIDATSDTTAKITFCWEEVKVSFTIMADTKRMVEKSLQNYADNTWHTYANAANYNVDNNVNLAKAYDWAQTSISLKEYFYNRYVMAKVLHAQGKDAEALKYANEAKALGDKNNDGFYSEYKDAVAKLITDLSAPAEKK